ncbi:MAG: helix-turn-helix transcriptional regulator [Pseudomonadota bacterium]
MNKSLIEINASSFQYITSVLPEFNRICKPLYDFGVPYFIYTKMYKDGSYLRLSNNNALHEAYFSTVSDQGEYYTHALESNSITSLGAKSKFYAMPSDINFYDKKTNYVAHLAWNFNIWHILYTCKKNDANSIHYYGFCFSRDCTYASQVYLNHLSILDHFILYFNEQAAHLIDTTDKRKLAYYNQNFNFQQPSQDKLLEHKIQTFLAETRLKKILIRGVHKEDIPLTPREVDCLHYLSLGHGAKSIARMLSLSPRTVECYLTKVKDKTGYSSKTKLLEAWSRADGLMMP